MRLLEKQESRKRRSWTFERLEDRQFFTATPLSGLEGVQWLTTSNSTAEGQQLVDALSQLWALQASSGSNSDGIVDAAVRAIPTDPALLYQWHLFNVGQIVNIGQFQDLYGVPGQDANVIPAWAANVSGQGINVAVVDSGVEMTHPDLFDNISFQYAYNALNGTSNVTPDFGDAHGTAVAGLIGAVANNLGGVGVAYNANIVPIKLLSGFLPVTPEAVVRAINANGAPIDIFNHSWGPPDAGLGGNRGVDGLSVAELIALTNSARQGRNGLGAIHVWAAGNGAEANDSAGSDGYVNSRYTIAVGIVDHDGQRANSDGTATGYGEMAPSVLIVAPSASGPTDIIHNFDTGSGIFTTDLTNGGYNLPGDTDGDPYEDTGFTARFGGTSAAAPIVSGVIALMLEANPNLTYRDVQEILVRSARQNNDQDESWITNATALFRDPIRHFGENLNDEIEWVIQPGEITTPAEQATTGPIGPTINGVTFSIHAVEGGGLDGEAGNGITVQFVTVPGAPAVIAVLNETALTITVSGTPTWSQIQQAVNAVNNGGNLELIIGSGSGSALFNPADSGLTGTLNGGVNAEGESPEAIPADPTYHPIFDPRMTPLPDPMFTNGAGFTVSYGRGTGATEYGYAHGVVDAALAVQLAKQWHLRDQNLPPEKTWVQSGVGSIRIRAAQVTNDESGEFWIPGGLSNANQGYIEYFNEFFKEPTVEEGDPEAEPPTEDMIDPDSLPFNGDNPPVNRRGTFIPLEVPAIDVITGGSNLMSIEWVEVQLNITGPADAMNYLRITLVSPDGTHSELTQNHFRPEDINKAFQLGTLPVDLFVGFGDSITPVDDNGTNSGVLNWVYSTNRHWGERSDSAPLIDPETGQIIAAAGTAVFNEITGQFQTAKGWELHFENYSGSDLSLNGVSVAFHGTPVGSPAGPVERVMGKVGIDGGRYIVADDVVVGAQDQMFNFDRNVFGFADPTQEAFAGGVTVYAIDNSTGQRVAEFLTGADGNYYFDLPAGEYTIKIEDPLGRSLVDAGANFDDEWVIQINTADGLTRTAGVTHLEEIEVDGEMVSVEVVDLQYNNLNFLLDPGSLPDAEVIFTGTVVGDLNGNGVDDVEDLGVFNFTVYADLNHTGQFEIGEPFAITDLDGSYNLVVPTATANTFTIGVKPPTGWETTAPASIFYNFYKLPGESENNVNFLVTPPTEPSGEGNGTIFGRVFSDLNGNGTQQANEKGLAGIRVFIDAPDSEGVYNGEYDEGETSTFTDANGAYTFGEVIVGDVRLDVVINEPYTLTSPILDVENSDGWIDLSLSPGQVSKENVFGIRNLAVNDYGDLVGAGFGTNGADPPSHFVVPGFQLGAKLDAEIRPRNMVLDPNVSPESPNYPQYIVDPNLHGIGDDADVNEASFDDEDGVVLGAGYLKPGVNFLTVTVGGIGGYLQGWIDFNDNGVFSASEQVFINLDLNPGTHQLQINVPQTIAAGDVAARFRWGTINLGATGHSIIGEVEDYVFDVKKPIAGDFNADNVVNDADYQVWVSTFGSSVDLRADGNGNGVVDAADYSYWRNNYGAVAPSGSGGSGLAAASSEDSETGQFAASSAPATFAVQLSAALPALDESPLGTVITPSSSADSGGGAGIAAVAIESGVEAVEFDLLSVTGIQFTSTASAREASFGEIRLVDSAEEPTTSDLLLVDRALARFVTEDDEESPLDALAIGTDNLDLALAAAFEEEGSWWSAI